MFNANDYINHTNQQLFDEIAKLAKEASRNTIDGVLDDYYLSAIEFFTSLLNDR